MENASIRNGGRGRPLQPDASEHRRFSAKVLKIRIYLWSTAYMWRIRSSTLLE